MLKIKVNMISKNRMFVIFVTLIFFSCTSEKASNEPLVRKDNKGVNVSVMLDLREYFHGDGSTEINGIEMLELIGHEFHETLYNSNIKTREMNHQIQVITIPEIDLSHKDSVNIHLTRDNQSGFDRMKDNYTDFASELNKTIKDNYDNIKDVSFDFYSSVKEKEHLYNSSDFSYNKLIVITSGILDDPKSSPIKSEKYPGYHSYLTKDNLVATKGVIPHDINLEGLDVLIIGLKDIIKGGNVNRSLTDNLKAKWKQWFEDMKVEAKNIEVMDNSIESVKPKVDKFLTK